MNGTCFIVGAAPDGNGICFVANAGDLVIAADGRYSLKFLRIFDAHLTTS